MSPLAPCRAARAELIKYECRLVVEYWNTQNTIDDQHIWRIPLTFVVKTKKLAFCAGHQATASCENWNLKSCRVSGKPRGWRKDHSHARTQNDRHACTEYEPLSTRTYEVRKYDGHVSYIHTIIMRLSNIWEANAWNIFYLLICWIDRRTCIEYVYENQVCTNVNHACMEYIHTKGAQILSTHTLKAYTYRVVSHTQSHISDSQW